MSTLIPKKIQSKRRTDGFQENHSSRFEHRKSSGPKYVITFAVAAIADGLQVAFPPFWIPVSIITALILFSLWGWRWEILCVLVPELAPGIDILPNWTAIALYLAGRDVSGVSKSKDGLSKEAPAGIAGEEEASDERTRDNRES